MWRVWFGRKQVLKTKRIAVANSEDTVGRRRNRLANDDSDDDDDEREQSAFFYAELHGTGPTGETLTVNNNIPSVPSPDQKVQPALPTTKPTRKVVVQSSSTKKNTDAENSNNRNDRVINRPSGVDSLFHNGIIGRFNMFRNRTNMIDKDVDLDTKGFHMEYDDLQEDEVDDDEVEREAEEMLRHMRSQNRVNSSKDMLPKSDLLNRQQSDHNNDTSPNKRRKRLQQTLSSASTICHLETRSSDESATKEHYLLPDFFSWFNRSSPETESGNTIKVDDTGSFGPQPHNIMNDLNASGISGSANSSTRNDNGKSLFNRKTTDENTFWKLYKESERHKLEESGMDKIQTTLEIIRYLFDWHKRYAMNSRLLTWMINDKSFWMFFLNRVKNIGVTIYFFNMMSLFFVFVLFTIYMNEEIKRYSESGALEDNFIHTRLGLVANLGPWFFINATLFLFFFLFIAKFEYKMKLIIRMNIDVEHYWLMTARIVCAVRFLVLVYTAISTVILSNLQTSQSMCYGMYIFPDNYKSFFFIIAVVIFDVYQISVVTFIPWPWPWTFRLCGIECAAMVFRFQSCSYLIGDFPKVSAVVIGVLSVIVMYYGFNISLASLVFERSMRTAYLNIQNQHQAAEEKMKVVNMMCQEIKLPAQQLLQTLAAVDQLRPLMTLVSTNLSMESFIHSAKKISFTLNALVDDLLFLTKVEELRFTMHVNDRIQVNGVISDTMLLIMKTIESPNVSMERLCFINTTRISQDYFVFCEKDCFRVMLYYSVLCLLAMASDDRLSDLSTVFERLQIGNAKKVVPLLAIYVQPSESSLSIGGHVLHVSIGINQPHMMLNSKFSYQHGGLFESCCLICHKVAKASRTNWNILPNRVEFVIDCKYLEPTLHPSLVPSSGDIPTAKNSFDAEMTGPVSGAALLPAWKQNNMESATISNPSVKNIIQNIGQINTKVGVTPPVNRSSSTSPPTSSVVTPVAGKAITPRGGKAITPSAGKKGAISRQNSRPAMTPTKRGTSTPTNKGPLQRGDSASFAASRLVNHMNDDIVIDKYVVHSLINSKAFVYLTDRAFEMIMSDILLRLRMKSTDIPTFREVTVADMKVYSIAFVQSISACREIRNKKFQGVIIMFSERLTYFDAVEKSWFDFGVPLPCSDNDLDNLMKFLMIVATKGFFHFNGMEGDADCSLSATPAMPSLPPGRSISQNSLMAQRSQYSEEGRDAKIPQMIKFPLMQYGSFLFTSMSNSFSTSFRTPLLHAGKSRMTWLMNPIPRDRRESYAKWRFLTPLGRIVHHTSYLELIGASSLLVLLTGFLLGVQSLGYFLLALGVYCLFYVRRIVYFGILKHFRVRYEAWWYFCSLTTLLGLTGTIISEFYQWKDFPMKPAISETRETQTTFESFITSKHGGMSGIQSLFFLIGLPIYMRYYTEFFPWPYGFVTTGLLAIRSIGIVMLYLSNYFQTNQIGFVLIVLVSYTINTIFYQYIVEVSHFESFSTLYDLLLSKDFFDRILLVGRINMTVPLMKLQDLQMTLIGTLKTQALQDKLLVTRSLQNQISALRLNHVVSQELLFQLTFGSGDSKAMSMFNRNDQVKSSTSISMKSTAVTPYAYCSLESKSKQYFISLMKAKLIKSLVRNICDHFAALTSGNRYSFNGFTAATISSNYTSNTTMFMTIPVNNDISVNIHLKLDPSLTLVRMDEVLFSTMLSFIFRLSIQRIEKSWLTSNTGRGGGSSSYGNRMTSSSNRMDEILIWIRPYEDKNNRQMKGNLKFSDLRMMLISVFDTATLPQTASNGAKLSNVWDVDPNDVGNGRKSINRLNSSSSIFTSSSTNGRNNKNGISGLEHLFPSHYPLCDRYMKFFDSDIRYKSGPIDLNSLLQQSSSSLSLFSLFSTSTNHYHNFQEIGLSYLLCPDSQKMQTCSEIVNKQQLVAIGQNTEDTYRKYMSGYAGILQELNEAEATSTKKFLDTIQAIKELSKERGLLRRKFPGNAYIMTTNNAAIALENSGITMNNGPRSHGMVNPRSMNVNEAIFDQLGRFVRSNELFDYFGWCCKTTSPMTLFDLLSPQYLESDCIMLDVDFRINIRLGSCNTALSDTRNRGGSSSASLFSHPHLQPHLLNFQHLDTKDLIHILRDNDYKGLIVVLHPNPSKFSKSTGSMINSMSATAASYAQKRQRLEDCDPFVDAVQANLHVTLPLTPQSVQSIVIAADEHLISSL